MRNAFVKELEQLARSDDRVVLLSGDIGNRMFDGFKEIAPDRFINAGIAEQNMIGVAAGLALSGYRPYVYTIVPFLTTRCMEQIRVDLCYHDLPVVLVGVGGGLSYSSLGATHHSCEDIAMLRSIPNMRVCCPGDRIEVGALVRETIGMDGPTYLRLGKKNEATVHREGVGLRMGVACVLEEGNEICVISTGNLLPWAAQLTAALGESGVSCSLVSMHTVKPLDGDYLKRAFAGHGLVVSVEEHSRIGGLASAIDQWRHDFEGGGADYLGIGTADRFAHRLGDQTYVRRGLGLKEEVILKQILDRFGGV